MSHYVAAALGMLLTSCAQVLLKRGATYKTSWRHSFWNWHTIVGYSMFVTVTILNVYALQAMDLKTLSAWTSINYILVIFLSWQVLNEQIERTTIWGCSLIVLGIIIFNWS